MPNPKWEVYENKATGIEYDLTDADAQSKLTSILDGTNIDSFGDVETAVSALQPKNLSHSIAGESTVEGALDAIAAGGGITVDDAMSSSSTNPVQNKVITSALAGKQATLTFDNFPTTGSTNPVTSAGIKSATTEIWGVIGPIEAGITSANAYEVGDHFECRFGYVTVIAPIAVGDTIENNVNVVGGTIASTMTQDAKDAFPRDEQAVVGAVNRFGGKFTSGTDNDVVYTVASDETVTAVGTVGSERVYSQLNSTIFKLKKGTYKLGINPSPNPNYNGTSLMLTNSDTSALIVNALGNTWIEFTLASDTNCKLALVCYGTGNAYNVVFKPIISSVDYNGDYVEPAMTNRELTEKVSNNKQANTIAELVSFVPKVGDSAMVMTTAALSKILTNNGLEYIGSVVITKKQNGMNDWFGTIGSSNFGLGRVSESAYVAHTMLTS